MDGLLLSRLFSAVCGVNATEVICGKCSDRFNLMEQRAELFKLEIDRRHLVDKTTTCAIPSDLPLGHDVRAKSERARKLIYI